LLLIIQLRPLSGGRLFVAPGISNARQIPSKLLQPQSKSIGFGNLCAR
jgi:hypothetical protein